MDDEKQLGINIRELRKLRLLTQDELAERAGFSQRCSPKIGQV